MDTSKDRDAWISGLRPGDVVRVDRLSELAPTLRELQAVIKAVHDRGAEIMEVSTGRMSKGDDAADMVLDAASEVKKGPPPKVSRENGGKGGRPAKQRETPNDVAELRWKDTVKYRTDIDALADMPGWNASAAYRAFGRSGRPMRGRQKKQD